jgi:hypothetical protein
VAYIFLKYLDFIAVHFVTLVEYCLHKFMPNNMNTIGMQEFVIIIPLLKHPKLIKPVGMDSLLDVGEMNMGLTEDKASYNLSNNPLYTQTRFSHHLFRNSILW